nr:MULTISPECIES: immunity 8 family protein [unclassified Bradyrhizobium]
MVTAKLRFLHSPDADPLEAFAPNGPFGVLVMAIVGPADGPGQESFDFMLCTPDWFSSKIQDDITIGRHHVFVKQYDYPRLQAFVEAYCAECSGASWREVAEKLGRLGKWEFEDFSP